LHSRLNFAKPETEVNETAEDGAWLEASNARHALRGNCSLGRSSGNSVILAHPKVSRRHAIIHVQNMGEFWLIDLGSANGTFVNNRRLHQPVRLHDRDHIVFGETGWIFRQPAGTALQEEITSAQRTIQAVEDRPCWLLVADLENFTQLCRSVVTERLAQLLGNWLVDCKEIVETHDGTINKYLGDGFLAYWRDDGQAEPRISAVMAAFKVLQKKEQPRFRIIVHCGTVAVGGVASMGEESLMGREVNLLFRLEKLAGSLGENTALSENARDRLQTQVSSRKLGEYPLKGFEGRYSLFAA